MNNDDIFKDQKHIDLIRKRLWCGREFGQAAVMVGAGFSRNAKKISENTPPFPLWDEIASRFYESLYQSEAGSKKAQDISKLGPLTLAGKYIDTFGRQALSDFLIQTLPDNSYYPGNLHELLLSLPWSDVFTTNYDTLIERTMPAIHERKYDLIYTISDIPGKMKPRIVKLHGSFPSHRPFIITDEDYRLYPEKYAPLVNMVQQSMMENIFCLVGFSGDDPNFLHWTKWVHKNLGESTPPIYLVGILNLTPAQYETFETKIIPIDLSSLFPQTQWPDVDQRHAKALEWFFLNLRNGEPPDISKWPNPVRRNILKKSDDLPPIPPGPAPLTEHSDIYPDLGDGNLEKVYENWRQISTEYPGWVIAPKSSRNSLRLYTEHWVLPIIRAVDKLSPPLNLFMLYELNWRLEKTLTPMFKEVTDKTDEILSAYCPLPNYLDMTEALIRPDNKNYCQLDWNKILNCWVEMVFAIARSYREDHQFERFKIWMNHLKQIIHQHTEWQMRWLYEDTLYHLCRLDLKKVRQNLENWPEKYDYPFWQVKRASILAEIGELKEASKIAEEALIKIRSRLQPYSIDYSLLSQEGWTIFLLNFIKGNETVSRDFTAHYQNRFDKLEIYNCNPWSIFNELKSDFSSTKPRKKTGKAVKKEFDPDIVTITNHYGSQEFMDSAYCKAYALIRMFEDGALPVKCGHITMFYDEVKNAVERLAPYHLLWAMSLMVRAGDGDTIKKYFDRVRIATLTVEEVELLYSVIFNTLFEVIKKDADHLSRGLQSMFLFTLPELLSRLCFRLSKENLQRLLEFTIDLYRSSSSIWHRKADELFKRILYAMPQTDILNNISALLSLPILTENGFNPQWFFDFKEPTSYIRWTEDFRLDKNFDRSSWTPSIKNLIRIVKDGVEPIARKHAITRLSKIDEINGFTYAEKEAYGEALWSRINPATNLPLDTIFYDFAFLFEPQGEANNVRDKFKKYMLTADFPRVVHLSTNSKGEKVKSSAMGSGNLKHLTELLGSTGPLFSQGRDEKYIDWSQDEAEQLIRKALAWWNEEKIELREEKMNFSEQMHEGFSQLVPVVSQVVLPRISNSEAGIKNLCKNLLFEMEELGINILQALPAILFIDDSYYDEICFKLRIGLNSTDEESIRNTISGIFYWIAYGAKGKIKIPPDDLLSALVDRIAARRQPGLNSALEILVSVLKWYPKILDSKQIESLCIALEYLLKETELPGITDREQLNNLSDTIHIEDRPTYRELSSKLAFNIDKYLNQNNKEIPKILETWKKISLSDPLPEVRRVWQ
ncbi:MAG: SIR2 family protein [Nitrospirae bacterium]|nr:SIR2 family protein [Nitrospirota bacterium]